MDTATPSMRFEAHSGLPADGATPETELADRLSRAIFLVEALEPLVEFSIDTTPLAARAEAIRADMQTVTTQLEHLSNGTGFVESTYDSMFQ
ncbi:MAG: hypothetical protein ACOCPT_05385 [Halanaeroarchaeum sp.]